MSRKIITLEQLTKFKEELYKDAPWEGSSNGSEVSGTNNGTNWTSLTIDGDTYSIPQGSSSGSKIEIIPTSMSLDFEHESLSVSVSSEDYTQVLEEQPDEIIFNYMNAAHITFIKQALVQMGNNDIINYIAIQDDIDGSAGSVYYLQVGFEVGETDVHCLLKDLCKSSGGGSGAEEIYPIAITATPSSTNIELAAAQNITLANMGEEAPDYTAAAYTLNAGLSYSKPYDAVLAEFGPGHQYLLHLMSADSSMLMYGIEESGMPIFDDDHPCAILIQLNGSSIDGVMMVSGGTYGPDGTTVATSLKGYFYSDTEFSFYAGGIRDTDIAAAISAGKIPVAIISWKYKAYQSWCPIRSFDEEDYYFESEYKGNKFTLDCDGSYWKIDWLPVYIEDVELIADVDYANNKVYFRSLDNLRESQEGKTMLRLKLYDNANHDIYLGKLELTLASQNAAGTENRYTSTEIVSGDVKITTLVISSTDTLPGGSSIYIQENEYYDFDEANMNNQTKLAEFYNICPAVLRAHTAHDGLQMYRLQNDYRAEGNQIIYTCLLFGTLVEMTLTESSGTYSIGVVRYIMTPASN